MKYTIAFLLFSVSSAAAQQGQAVGPYISPTSPVFSTTVSIGNASPKAPLDINSNLSSSPALLVSTDLARLQAADGTVNGIELLSYGAAPANAMAGALAGGTAASPTFAPASKNMMVLRGYGFNGATFQNGGLITIRTANQWSATDQSTQIDLYTTAGSSTSLTLAASVNPSGCFSVGPAVDCGSGSLNINADIFAPNLPTTTGALAAAICYTASTGRFQRDTNAGGCLVSSERYKHDIEPLASTLDEVMSLKPVAFTYNDDVGVKGRQVGFLAEQAALVDERLVGFNPDGSAQSVRYMQMSAILVGAIQQLKADNDDLRACQQNWKCRIFGIGK